MTPKELATYIGLFITIIGTIFGILQFFKNKKLKRVTLTALQSAAGDLCKIQQSTEWTFNNMRHLQQLLVNLDDSDLKKQILKIASDGQGDAASADRMVITLFSHLMTMQETQFNTKEIIHPEKNEFPLWRKQFAINRTN
jgi:hypothetical protein